MAVDAAKAKNDAQTLYEVFVSFNLKCVKIMMIYMSSCWDTETKKKIIRRRQRRNEGLQPCYWKWKEGFIQLISNKVTSLNC